MAADRKLTDVADVNYVQMAKAHGWDGFNLHPDLSNMEIKLAIEQSASQYNNPDYYIGYGIPNLAMADIVLTGVSITDYDQDELLKVFPVPFKDKLNIWFYSTSNQDVNIEITNEIGKRVYTGQETVYKDSYNPMLIPDLKNLANGIYFFKLRTEKKSFIKKVLKQ